MRAIPFLACVLALAQPSCVVSTYGSPDTEPDVPLPPEQTSSAPAPAEPAGPAQVGARHILVQYRGSMRAAPYVERSKDEALAFAEQLRQKALAGEKFEDLARKNSDDRGSAAAGGDLGVFRREQMVKEFSDAAFALAVGDISEVIESQFGFHVIQRTE